MTQFGTERVILPLDDKGSTLTTSKKYRNGEIEKALRHYRIRVKVTSSEDEMTEFLKFTNELDHYRINKTLTTDPEDSSTRPAFIIDHLKDNSEGIWFVIKNYCLVDIH